MFTYYLCNDNETVYRIEFSLKPEDKKYYLSLLENYLNELVFVSENEMKKLVNAGEVEKENRDKLSIEDSLIFVKKKIVINTDKIEDYLPLVVTIKTKKYFFLRTCTICLLIKLLSNDLGEIDNPYIKKISKMLGNFFYINFELIFKTFFDDSGDISGERFYDYHSLMELLRNLEVEITEKYSRSSQINFWQGDEAERELADGIVTDSAANKVALKKLNFELIK